MSTPAFFIFGKHRSGSTMLSALLNSHPDVYVINDSFVYQMFALSVFDRKNTIIKHLGHIGKAILAKASNDVRADLYRIPYEALPNPTNSMTKRELESFIGRLLERYRRSDDDTTLDDVSWLADYEAHILNYNPDSLYTGAFSIEYYLSKVFEIISSRQSGKSKFVGEKTPPHSFLAPWLRQMYPNTKFITLMRNPVTNIASMFSRYDTVDKHLLIKATDRYMSFHHSKLNILYDKQESLVIRYEDLIKNTNENLKTVYDYLGVSSDTIYNDLVTGRPNYTGNKIDTNRANKSKSVLREDDINYIKTRCRRVFLEHYPEEL